MLISRKKLKFAQKVMRENFVNYHIVQSHQKNTNSLVIPLVKTHKMCETKSQQFPHCAGCGNYRYFPSQFFFWKNFVKSTDLEIVI